MKILLQIVIALYSVVMVASSFAQSNPSITDQFIEHQVLGLANTAQHEKFLSPFPKDGGIRFGTRTSLSSHPNIGGTTTGTDPAHDFGYLGALGGAHTGIDDFTTETPPHLRVEFIVQFLENVSINNGGAIQNMRINWSAHSDVATDEPYFEPDSWVPPPGNFLIFNNPPIYIGLVSDGCGKVPVFPITFYSEVYNGGGTLGEFSATDNSTIQPNGYWNFSYTFRVSDDNGGESDIRVKGMVRALCVW